MAAKAVVLLLLDPDAPAVDLSAVGEGDTASMSGEEHRKQVVASLVGEIVLCVKEVSLHVHRPYLHSVLLVDC